MKINPVTNRQAEDTLILMVTPSDVLQCFSEMISIGKNSQNLN